MLFFDYDKFLARFNGLLVEDGRLDGLIAEDLGIASYVLSKYKKGTTRARLDVIVKTAHLFNVSTDYLLGCTDTKTPNVSIRSICDTLGLTDDSVDSIIAITTQADRSSSVAEVKDSSTKPDEFIVEIPEPNKQTIHYTEPSRRTVVNGMLQAKTFSSLIDQIRMSVADRVTYHIMSKFSEVRKYNNSKADMTQQLRIISSNKIDLYHEIDNLIDCLSDAYIEKYAHELNKAITEYALRTDITPEPNEERFSITQ